MTRDTVFEKRSLARRTGSMVKVDFRRMFTSKMFYIMCAIAFVMPILVLVMTTGFSGTTISDPTTGAQTTMEAFTNTWQIIATEAGGGAAGMAMDMTSMMNINLMYFMVGVFICLFVAEDFRSGYSKNLFTVRAKKGDYVISKTLAGFAAGTFFLLCFLLGAVFGGSIAGLSFELGSAGSAGLVMCMIAKTGLMAVFSAIFLLVSTFGKHRAWLSILVSFGAGMLLFMMIPMMSPLNAGVIHVGMCLAGGITFSIAIGLISNMVLNRTSLVG